MNTNTQLTPINRKPKALEVMASRLSVEPDKMLATLKATVFKNASTEELLALVVVANEYQLNPFLKEIYAFPAKGGGIVPVISIDGWNKMLIRQESFDGIEFDFIEGQDGLPYACTATVFIKNRSHPVKVTEYLEECRRNTDPWNNMPRRMLRHRALCQASRLAFGFAGVYSEDEAKDFIEVSTASQRGPAKLVDVRSAEPEPEGQQEAGEKQDARKPEPASNGAKAELQTIVTEGGFTFTHLQTWGRQSGNIEGADTMASFDEVPEAVAKRLIRAKAGLLKELALVKEMAGDK